MIHIEFVREEDRVFWFSLDRHLPGSGFSRKVRDRQGYVIFDGDEPVGILRYGLFWDNTPFCNMLSISSVRRRQGYGRLLMRRWEDDMRAEGYGMLLVSTQVDEEAQHFYRKLGYADCGGMTATVPGYEQPMELFMVKAL